MIAYFVLLVTFASFVAAGLPLITALLGVGASLAIVFIGTRFLTITSTTPLLALMLGLAVGIDYALFIISRHQDQLKHGIDPEESAARAVATSGSAVVFAAMTVIIALLGLAVAGHPVPHDHGRRRRHRGRGRRAHVDHPHPGPARVRRWRVVAKRYRPGPTVKADAAVAPSESTEHAMPDAATADAAETDAASASTAPTAGVSRRSTPTPWHPSPTTRPPPKTSRSPTRDTPPTEESAVTSGFFAGWVRTVTRWPIVTVVLIVGLLRLAAVPAAGLRLTLPDAGSLEEDTPGRVTYDLDRRALRAGLQRAADRHRLGHREHRPGRADGRPRRRDRDRRRRGIRAAGDAQRDGRHGHRAGRSPTAPPTPRRRRSSSRRCGRCTTSGEEEYGVDLSVTGYTAAGIDISDRLAGALLPFGVLVVGLSLVLLAMVFRSIVVPVTAALGYVLSIGAAFGLTSLVFVDGFLAGPLNVADVGSIVSFMPIILMGVLFGLAMDYEVFLVSRMREDFVHHGDPERAVDEGFIGSARVVTAAAIIMFSVFAAFVPDGDASIQPIAFGLAVGVAIDAFLVRMTLIPAVLVLFGRHAWWIPAWLDRSLPRFDVEGEGLAEEFALADWPAPGSRLAIAAEGVRVDGRSTTSWSTRWSTTARPSWCTAARRPNDRRCCSRSARGSPSSRAA